MRRRFGSDDSPDRFWAMFRERGGLRMLLAQLPEGSTLEDALRLHRRVRQLGRRPSRLLDEELGIVRP